MILHIQHPTTNLYFQEEYIHINNPTKTYSYVKIATYILRLLRHYHGTLHSFSMQIYNSCHIQKMTCKHAKHRLITVTSISRYSSH